MNLTKEQQKAADAFYRFLLSNEKNFYLFGSAGTGKSFLVEYLLTTVLDKYKQTTQLYNLDSTDSVVVSAPTHKAVEALYSKISRRVVTTFDAIKVRVNTYGGKVQYIPYGNTPSIDILVIDECSFLPKEILIYIEACAKKIVYIGDPYQLVPEKGINWLAHTSEAQILSEVKRTSNPDIRDMSIYLRNLLIGGARDKINVTFDSDCVHILNDEQMIQNLESTFKTSDMAGKILCFTNERVLKYLQYIQKNIRKCTKNLIPGKMYINNSFALTGRDEKVYPETPVFLKELIIEKEYKGIEYEIWSCTIYGRHYDIPIVKDANKARIALKKIKVDPAYIEAYDIVKNRLFDARQPWASTIHKSQGSSYDTVFIDLDSFNACKDLETAIRLLYVAVSRAVHTVYFYGTLPKRFGSIKDANAMSI